MDKVTLLNVNNAPVEVNVIRFFSLNNNHFFIYSMNEVDEQGYVKLYAVKITANNNLLVSTSITDENEWTAVKEMIKTIIKGNQEGNLNVQDLDYRYLHNMKMSDSRVFKLSTQLVDLLQANKKAFADVAEQTPEVPVNDAPAANANPVVTETPAVNVNPVAAEAPAVEQANPTPTAPTENAMPEVDYQAMYLAEKANNDKLNQEMQQLRAKLESIKNML